MNNGPKADFPFEMSDVVARNYESRFVPAVIGQWVDRLVAAASLQPEFAVLDAGCGTGIVARKVHEILDGNGSVVGLDVGLAMLRLAEELAPDGPTWIHGDVTALPFADASFDVVFCQQVIQFVENKAGAWNEFRRVLKPGGLLALAAFRSFDHSPGFNALAESLARQVGPPVGMAMRQPSSYGDLGVLRSAASHAGFREIAVTIEIGAARFASPADMLETLLSSTPMGIVMANVPDEVRQAVLADMRSALQPHTADNGVVFPLETALVRAVA